MMKNYDQSVKINHNPSWSYIPDHPYRILIIDSPGSGNLIKNKRPDVEKFIYTSKIHSNQSTNYLLSEQKK